MKKKTLYDKNKRIAAAYNCMVALTNLELKEARPKN